MVGNPTRTVDHVVLHHFKEGTVRVWQLGAYHRVEIVATKKAIAALQNKEDVGVRKAHLSASM
jgi:hypothetical protein